jgi:chorismate mutase
MRASGAASADEQRRALIAALLEERQDYEAKVALAEDKGDAERAAYYASRIAAVDESLAYHGHGVDEPLAAERRASRRSKPVDEPQFV